MSLVLIALLGAAQAAVPALPSGLSQNLLTQTEPSAPGGAPLQPQPATSPEVPAASPDVTEGPAASPRVTEESVAAGPVAEALTPAAIASDAPLAQDAQLMGALPEPDPDKQRLVAGAPLYNPNVAVHIVQRKQFTERGRHELTLYPATTQLNGKFTQHFGTALSYVYHLHENLGIHLTPRYNWSAQESPFNLELVEKVRQQGQPATTLLLNWAATGGVEVTPLYGKFAIYDGLLAQFSLVLIGGAGIGQTSHLLKPVTFGDGNQRFAETYGDTGRRFVGEIGGGLRVQIGDRFTLRMEVRDLVYTARVEEVNGCNLEDLNSMYAIYETQLEGNSLEGVAVRGSCNVGAFQGDGGTTGENRIHDVPRARDLVMEPSADVLNNVGFHAGFSIIF